MHLSVVSGLALRVVPQTFHTDVLASRSDVCCRLLCAQ